MQVSSAILKWNFRGIRNNFETNLRFSKQFSYVSLISTDKNLLIYFITARLSRTFFLNITFYFRVRFFLRKSIKSNERKGKSLYVDIFKESKRKNRRKILSKREDDENSIIISLLLLIFLYIFTEQTWTPLQRNVKRQKIIIYLFLFYSYIKSHQYHPRFFTLFSRSKIFSFLLRKILLDFLYYIAKNILFLFLLLQHLKISFRG